jgi:flagellar motility protein MotE (MotC chaperone)
MLKKLSSPWIGSIIGLAVYLAVTATTWNAATAKISAANQAKAAAPASAANERQSWLTENSEVENLIKDLREEREALSKREKDLNDLAARLQHERDELNQLTQMVTRMQKDFDASVSRVSEDEMTNLKKLAKTYSGMEADGAAGIFKGMDDATVVKIMMFMKDSETAPILTALSRLGEAESKRAGELTDKLRVAVVPKKK